MTDRQVFWLSVILARPSRIRGRWYLRGCQHHSSGGCGGVSPLPLHLLVTLLLHPDSRQTGCLKQQAGYYAIRMSRSLAVRGGGKDGAERRKQPLILLRAANRHAVITVSQSRIVSAAANQDMLLQQRLLQIELREMAT
jgi:hypothetical protein